MPFLLIHGLGQTSEAWEKTRRLLPFGDVHCPDLVPLLDGAPAAYDTLYRAFAAYCGALPGASFVLFRNCFEFKKSAGLLFQNEKIIIALNHSFVPPRFRGKRKRGRSCPWTSRS